MSKLPYMELYVDDYDAATMHLTFEEDGIYNRLLRLCWRTPRCSIPNDEIWICRRMRSTEWDKIKLILCEFFKRYRGRWFSPWQQEIFQGQRWRQYLHEQRLGLTQKKKQSVFKRDGLECAYCKTCLAEKYHIDHVLPISRGGNNNMNNLVVSCAACNLSKGQKLLGEWN